MRKIRCCVIDDEPLALDLIKGYVEKTPFLEFVNAFPSASPAIKTIIEEDIDLVFLDIQMSELNGTEFARVVPPHCRVVFVTAFDRYAIEAFRVNALDYLLKPVSYTEFMEAANRALRWFVLEERARSGNEGIDSILVKSEYKLVQIPIDDILYIEGLKDYVKIYLESTGGCVMSLMSLKTFEAGLPSSRFMRVHRSFIVQMSKVRLIERNRIVFGKQYIPISDSYKNVFNEYVNKHILSPIKED